MEGSGLAGRRVLLHVCGGIAAVKVPSLITALRQEGADVRVTMTAAATSFISPLALQALSGHPVAHPGRGGAGGDSGMPHVDLAQWAEAHLVVPATASTIARLACGLADDIVSATLLASRAPLLLAPAMETGMWESPATQANLQTLRGRGAHLVGPASGRLASGHVGMGRMAEPGEIVEAARLLLEPGRELQGVVVLVTAGGTREPIDPVRYLGNRSSGRMGAELARAALRRGAEVHLVTAAESPEPLLGGELVRVETAAQMLEACLERLPRTRLLVMAAAIADYRLAEPFGQKLHRTEHEVLDLHLVPNPDLLQELVAKRPEGLRVVGFAAETEDVRRRGRDKLRRKGCDLLVANPVAGPRSAMGGDWAEAVVLYPDGREVELPWSPKSLVAGQILDLAAGLLSSPGDGTEAS